MKRAHPEKTEDIAREAARVKAKAEDHAKRAKVQCLLCEYAATKAGNMTRHYTEVHGYDKELAESVGLV